MIFAPQNEQTETIRYVFTGSVKSLAKATKSAQQYLAGYSHQVKNTTRQINSAIKGLGSIYTGSLLGKMVKQSISYTESLNLFTVAMGEAADTGHKFIESMQEIYGLDPKTLLDQVGNFNQLADAINMPTKAAANMSLTLTKATVDLASLFNVDVNTVFNNLSSGMQGMSRAVRRYGMDIRAVTLQQTALSLGITRQVENMSEADRMGLRFITMMRQARNASGDFARTIETPANQLRVFKEQIVQLGRAIGDFLIAPIGRVIQYVNGFVMALRMAITFLGTMLGLSKDSADIDYSGVNDGTDAVTGLGGAAGDAAKKVKELLAPFDELNILKEKDSSGGGAGLGEYMDPAIAEAMANMQYQLEEIEMKANKVRNALLEFFGFTVEEGKITGWSKDVFLQGLEQLEEEAPVFAKQLAEKINAIVERIDTKKIGQTVGRLLNIALETGVSFVSTIDFRTLGVRISEFFTNGIAEIDFYELGRWCALKYRIISELFIGLAASMSDPVGSFSTGWEMLGQKVAEWVTGAIESIDWKATGAALNSVAIGLYKAILNAFVNIDWEQVGAHIAEFLNEIDFNQLFGNIINTIVLVLQAVVRAFGSLWENADPETKSLLILTIATLFTKVLGKLSTAAKTLTGSYKKKNQSLERQTDLESQAATVLSNELVPSFVATAGTALMTQEALDNLGTSTATVGATATAAATQTEEAFANIQVAAEESLEPAKTAASELATTCVNMGVSAVVGGVLSETAFGSVNSAVGSLDAAPATAFADGVVTSMGRITASCNEALTALNSVKQASGQPATAPTAGATAVTSKQMQAAATAAHQHLLNAFGKYSYLYAGANSLQTQMEESLQKTGSSNQFDASQLSEAVQAAVAATAKAASQINDQTPPDTDSGIDWGTFWTHLAGTVAVIGAIAATFFSHGAAAPTIPAAASVFAFGSGGVVTGPTLGLIGEEQYDEMIMPLGNSPQMRDFVQRVADAVETRSNTQPVEVKVYIGQDEFDAYTYKAARRGEIKVGKQPIRLGG